MPYASSAQLVSEHLESATEVAGRHFAAKLKDEIPLAKQCQRLAFDSPLEEIFWIWWQSYHALQSDYFDAFAPQGWWFQHHQCIEIESQTYELDFSVMPWTSDHLIGWTPIAIELDGHEFHERTRQQVVKRDRRDRALQKAGWRIFHFSFTEFVADPGGCVQTVWDFAANQYIDCQRTSVAALIAEMNAVNG